MKNAILGISFVANAALAIVVVVAVLTRPSAFTEAADLRPLGEQSSPSAVTTDAPKSPADLYQSLLGSGLAESQAKSVLLAYLQLAEEPDSADGEEAEYWKPIANPRSASHLLAAEERREVVRNTLVSLYGEEARDDPAFAALFRPLDHQLPFLSSEQQLGLTRLQLEQPMAQPPSGPPHAGAGRPTAMPVDAARSYEQKLAAILEPPELFEYLLRESPLAVQLRTSGVGLTEHEYREVFRIIHEFRTSPSPAGFVEHRRALAQFLGEERFARLTAASDPEFAAIRDVGTARELPEHEIFAAYAIMQEARDGLIAAASSGPNDAGRADAVREHIDRRDRRLRELVGNNVADEMVRAHSANIVARRRQDSASP